MIRKIFYSIIIMTSLLSAQKYNPVADGKAIITFDQVRFTVLTPRVIRMEWSEDGKFEDHASLVFVNRNLQVPEFSKNISGDVLTITTNELKLSYKLKSGKFTNDNLSIEFNLGNDKKLWTFEMENKGNLKGTTRTLDGTNGDIYGNDENRKVILEEGIISREGWC